MYFYSKKINIERYEYAGHLYTSDEIYKHMDYIDNLLTKNNIKHWIMFGTLLGAVREQNIITYDYDFDFGANIQDKNNIINLNKQIKKDKYELYFPIDANAYSLDQKNNKIMWRISIKVKYNGYDMGDIYLFDKFEDNMMRRFDKTTNMYMTPNITFPSWFIDNLIYVTIRNKQYLAPRDPEILLKHIYGKTWKIPIQAKAQGGEGDNNSDYYGMSKKINIKFLLDYLKTKNVIIIPNLKNKINYVCPYEQKQWILNNDII